MYEKRYCLVGISMLLRIKVIKFCTSFKCFVNLCYVAALSTYICLDNCFTLNYRKYWYLILFPISIHISFVDFTHFYCHHKMWLSLSLQVLVLFVPDTSFITTVTFVASKTSSLPYFVRGSCSGASPTRISAASPFAHKVC